MNFNLLYLKLKSKNKTKSIKTNTDCSTIMNDLINCWRKNFVDSQKCQIEYLSLVECMKSNNGGKKLKLKPSINFILKKYFEKL